jgi:hypothetical protein
MRLVCKRWTQNAPGCKRRRGIAFVAAVAWTAPMAQGAAAPEAGPRPDKSLYSLWNPAPGPLLRDLASDRPDRTESPFTVDAGHFQLEMDVFTFSYDQHNSERNQVRQTAWSLMPVNLKVGLLNRLDAQLVLEPYVHRRTEDRSASPGRVTHQSGYGDTTLRAKANLWGNDGGATALALLPFVTFPTSQDDLGNDAVQGGLVLPFSLELPLGFELGGQTGFEVAQNSARSGHHFEIVHSLALGRALTAKLSAYVEFWSLVSAERGSEWQGTVDFGFNYLLTKNLKLDAGVNLGVTRAAVDWMPFLGLTWRY